LKDIKLFARHGGPDLSDLRNVRIAGYLPACVKVDDAFQFPEPIYSSNPIMSSSRPSSRSRRRVSATTSSTKPTTNTTKTKSTRAYDRDFQQHLVDNVIYPNAYEYPDGSLPAELNNWEDFK